MANPIGAEHVCITPEIRHWYQRIFIYQFSNYT